MTPVYLNPASSSFPFVDLEEEQHLQLFLSPHQAATSLSGPTNFFNTTHDQRESKLAESRQHDDHEARTAYFNCMVSFFFLSYHFIFQCDLNFWCREALCGARTSFSNANIYMIIT
jgi:hypothetical protein